MGPPIPPPMDDTLRQLLFTWDTRNPFKPLVTIKQWLGSSWADVYASLCHIASNPETRPDFILADFVADAVHDISREYAIPIAVHWPQMPTMMLPTTYIPGQAGLQCEVLTSEHATMWQRIQNELVIIRGLPQIFEYFIWFRDLRRRSGVKEPIPVRGSKPAHLLLVNSFFGLEAAKDLPPLVAAIGPVLPDIYPPLDLTTQEFLDSHNRVLYHAMGTVLTPPVTLLHKIANGILQALNSGVIDGVVWVAKNSMAECLDDSSGSRSRTKYSTLIDILEGKHPNILILHHAQQRAILDHPHTAIYLTHGGGSSTNELTYHGVPAITLAVMTDQTQNALRLRDAGVSIPMARETFTARDLSVSIRTIVQDVDGSFARNVWRMKQIARVCSRRKHVAADLIEEAICDHEGRFVEGKEVRPMHRQTADVRMAWYRARNWDLWAVVTAVVAVAATTLAIALHGLLKLLGSLLLRVVDFM